MGVSLNIKNAHAAHKYGELIVLLTWVNDERAMVLMTGKPNAPWFVVCESASYRYDDDRYLAAQARKAAEVLGLKYSVGAWYKIAKIIHDGLPDLIRMPTAPERELAQAFGDMTLRGDGKILKQEEMRHEKDVVEYE